jgi:Tfp pilus assembly protein PilN
MKAVNLIPAESRRGAGGHAGRSGGAAYVLLGALGVLVLMAGLYVSVSSKVKDRKAELATLTAQATAAEAQAASLKSYTDFATLRARRVATVQSIAASRFDWSGTLHEVARTIPSDVWLTALRGTVSPDVSVQGGAAVNALRASITSPALELLGCTTSQPNVSRMIAAMRQVDGVRRVSLLSSSKNDAAQAGGGGGAADCTQGSAKFPKFQLVIFFDPKPAPAAVTAPPAAAAATDQTASGSAPATSTGAAQ